MGKSDPVDGLSDDERALLGEALRALRRKRGQAWNAACDAAAAQRKRPPPLREYGIEGIKRLARRIGELRPIGWKSEPDRPVTRPSRGGFRFRPGSRGAGPLRDQGRHRYPDTPR